MLYYSDFLSCCHARRFFFLSQTSTIDRKLVSENMKKKMMLYTHCCCMLEKVFPFFALVKECLVYTCNKVLLAIAFSNKEKFAQFSWVAFWNECCLCSLSSCNDKRMQKEAMIPISALFLAKTKLQKNSCTQIRRYLKLEKIGFASAFLRCSNCNPHFLSIWKNWLCTKHSQFLTNTFSMYFLVSEIWA